MVALDPLCANDSVHASPDLMFNSAAVPLLCLPFIFNRGSELKESEPKPFASSQGRPLDFTLRD